MDSIAALVLFIFFMRRNATRKREKDVDCFVSRAVMIKWATKWAQAHTHFTCPTISWWARVVVV